MEKCICLFVLKKTQFWDFPDGPVLKNSPSNTGNVGLIPGQKKYFVWLRWVSAAAHWILDLRFRHAGSLVEADWTGQVPALRDWDERSLNLLAATPLSGRAQNCPE